jgi:hypothetical protein
MIQKAKDVADPKSVLAIRMPRIKKPDARVLLTVNTEKSDDQLNL